MPNEIIHFYFSVIGTVSESVENPTATATTDETEDDIKVVANVSSDEEENDDDDQATLTNAQRAKINRTWVKRSWWKLGMARQGMTLIFIVFIIVSISFT